MHKPKDSPKVGITFYLERPVVQDIDRLAESEHRSRANLITVLLQEALEARDEVAA